MKRVICLNLSFIDKFVVIFRYVFSSFLSIEMFLMTLLLFFVLLVNLKRNNRLIQMLAIGIYLGFVLGILISYTSYVKTCIDSFIKEMLNYIYFPSTIVYFFIIVFVTIMILYNLFSKKLSFFKKVFNYLFFSFMYFLFMSFISLATYDGVDFLDVTKLYQNDTILSFVQISNLLLIVWAIFTCFYHLYLFYKKKYD